ncbi:MAG: hypothetical protein JW703_03435 [Candidatus Diapherotrites archaeon]|nr:hypothetical protein [Candidatus Diapherotrites archaeon]
MLEGMVLFLENFIRDVLDVFNEHESRDESHSSQCAEVLLRDVPHPDLYFYLRGSYPIKNLCELSEHLNEMDEHTFVFHVNSQKNDFAEWIATAVGDKVLAEKIFNSRTLPRMANAVNVRVEWLKSKTE